MDWNEIQNLLSNIVFGILLFAMVIYWVNLFFFNDKVFIIYYWSDKYNHCECLTILYSLFTLDCCRLFPLSNLYESLLFLTWTLINNLLIY
jgi:ABC-type transport system involved in cytochrome c biogenesis permease subunit